MCLTEPQAGSDLALVPKALPHADGTYLITRLEEFPLPAAMTILPENIVHLVLARPGSPSIRGISTCFLWRPGQ